MSPHEGTKCMNGFGKCKFFLKIVTSSWVQVPLLDVVVRMWNKINTSSMKNNKFDRMDKLRAKTT